jgi:hypothetical protein
MSNDRDPKSNPFGELSTHLPEQPETKPPQPRKVYRQPSRAELAARHNRQQGGGGETWLEARARGNRVDFQAGPYGMRQHPGGASTSWNGKLSGL